MKSSSLLRFNVIACAFVFFVCTAFSSNNAERNTTGLKAVHKATVLVSVINAGNNSLQVEFVPSNYTMVLNAGQSFHGNIPIGAGSYTITLFEMGSHTYNTSGGKHGNFTGSVTFMDSINNGWTLSVN